MIDFKDEILEELIGRELYTLESTHGNRADAIKEYRRLRRLRAKEK